jgi:hypothetical protein
VVTGERSQDGGQGREIKSNVTDNESAIMVTSHGTIQGDNGQALVDSEDQVIVHAEAFGESQDLHLIPAVREGAKEVRLSKNLKSSFLERVSS